MWLVATYALGSLKVGSSIAPRANKKKPPFWTDPQKLDIKSNQGGFVLWASTVRSSS